MKYVLLMMFCITALATRAQHCGWDHSSIIIVDAKYSATGKVPRNLYMVLADSTGKPYQSDWNLRNNQDLHLYTGTDTLRFALNKKQAGKEFSEYRGPFPFGVDHYMLLVYYNNYFQQAQSSDVIRVTYYDEACASFKTLLVPLHEHHITSLCTNSQIWDSKEEVAKRAVKLRL